MALGNVLERVAIEDAISMGEKGRGRDVVDRF